MKILTLVLLLFSTALALADVTKWLQHENVRQGVRAAYNMCLSQLPTQTITFHFNDDKIPTLLTVTCKEIIDHVEKHVDKA